MKYKMVVMDMDDTLLRDDLSISEKNKSAILKAQEMGVKVVLASGRPTPAMKPYAEKLHLDKFPTYILSYNGAIITETNTGKKIYQKVLSGNMARELYDYSKKFNVFIHTYKEEGIITPKHNEYTDIEAKITNLDVIEVEDFKEKIGESVVKVLMVEHPKKLKDVETKLRPHVEEKLNMFTSKPYFLEFMENGVDKGASIGILANSLGIKQEEVICIGDAYNDLSMIKYAGLGVAMGNAIDDIKEQADFVAKTNMEDGVAEVIEKFILTA